MVRDYSLGGCACRLLSYRVIWRVVSEFNSDNTRRLNVEETKAKIAALEYIQNELNGIANLAK